MPHAHGQRHHKSTLTDDEVDEMREIYEQWKAARVHKGYETLAAIFGCGVSTARDIIKMRTRVNR